MMETEQANNNDDIMSRRLKNRERQRRYRARKRLEADKQKASTSAPVKVETQVNGVEHVEEPNKKPCNDVNTLAASAPVKVETQVNGVSDNYVTRVHCRRDWKNDARMAQKMKEQQSSLNAVVGADVSSCNETKVESVAEELPNTESGIHPNNIERSIAPGRRRWKEDARNRSAEVVTGASL